METIYKIIPMSLFDNPILRPMAEKALRKYFKENDMTTLMITENDKGEFEFVGHKGEIVVMQKPDYDNLLKLATE